MAFSIRKFYEELDRHYQKHDNRETEAFLLDMVRRTRHLHDSMPTQSACPTCAVFPTVNIEYVSVCNEAACFFRGISKWQKSLELFDEALRELEFFSQTDTPNYAVILLNKAGTLRLLGNHELAIETFKKSETIILKSQSPNPFILASISNNLALVCQDMGQWEDAAKHIQKALSYLPEGDNTCIERATTYNNLAVTCRQLGRLDDAFDAVNRSLRILEGADGGLNAHYPAALNTLASLYFQRGDDQQALELFKSALTKTEIIYGRNIDYAKGCLNIARTYEKLNDPVQAEKYRKSAEEILSGLRETQKSASES